VEQEYVVEFVLLACAIRGDSEIQGIKLPGGKDGEYIETKLCMFADDTQLFNKNDESVEKKNLEILKYLDTKPLVLIQVCAYLNNI
jgi:hypothetical protein